MSDCTDRPRACFTCGHKDCTYNDRSNAEENTYVNCGHLPEPETSEKAKLRKRQREYARKKRREKHV